MVSAGAVVRRDVDWTYAAFVAFSCFVHFGVAAWARTADWPIDDAPIPDVYAGLIVREFERPVFPTAGAATIHAIEVQRVEVEAPATGNRSAPARSSSAHPSPTPRDVRSLGVLQVLTHLGEGEGVAQDVLRGGSGPSDLDDVLSAMDGVAMGSRVAVLQPRGGGDGDGDVASIGPVATEGDRDVTIAAPESERPVRMRIRPSPPEPIGCSDCIPEDEVLRVVRQRLTAIRMCYERPLRNDRTLGGRIVVDFTIGGSGRVVEAHVADSSLRDPAVGECMVATFRRFRFPAPTGGAARFSFPFLLHPID